MSHKLIKLFSFLLIAAFVLTACAQATHPPAAPAHHGASRADETTRAD